MSYCINSTCPKPDDPGNTSNRICRNCGSELLIQGRYQVMRLLSDKSGFGKIYEAYQGASPKILKVLKEELNQNSRAVELFQQEAIVLSKLNHPGIPKVTTDGYFQFFPRNRDQPLHCIIMEKIEGANLKQWMSQQHYTPIGERQAINWLREITEILDAVHQQNYFHRDIKPENIMIRPNGQLVLIDFGTAREMTYTYLAEVGGVGITKISSPGYTPPEQEKGHAIPQSDFYALGRTFVYLLTGKQLTNKTIYDPLTDEFRWRKYAINISDNLANFIDRLMAPQAVNRPENTQEILEALDRLATDLAQTQIPTDLGSIPTIVSSSLRTKLPVNAAKGSGKLLLIGVAMVGAIAVGSGIWYLSRLIAPSAIAIVDISHPHKKLSGHTSYVNYIIISPDGQKLISASADKTIKIWDLVSGQEIKTLKGHSSYVNYLAISPDGQILISASADKTIKTWDLATNKEIYTLNGHNNYVNALTVSSDGQLLASGSADKTVKIWNLATGKEIRTLIGHTSPINSVAISLTGEFLASGSADKTIKIWNLATGQEIRTLIGHTSPVNSVAITPDGQFLASGSADKTIKIWNLATGQEIRTLRGHSNSVNYLAIRADGQKLISSSADKTIKIWNLVNGQEMQSLTGYPQWINYLAITNDWQTIATGSGDKNITVFPLPP